MQRRKMYDPKYDGKPNMMKLLTNKYTESLQHYKCSVSKVVIIILVGYILISRIWNNWQDASNKQYGNEEKNPKIKAVNDMLLKHVTDPQEQEFKAILEHNAHLKEGEEPLVPLFNPNAHIDEKHNKLSKNDPHWKLSVLHPKPKEFPVSILQEPHLKCENSPTLLILVFTNSNNFGARKAIRLTWGSQEKYQRFNTGVKWKTIFVLGRKEADGIGEKEVLKESIAYGDVLQANFSDNQYENTRKIMTALKWLPDNIKNCRPTFIMKTTDRIFMNMFSIMDWLDAKFASNSKDVYIGKLLRLDTPNRDVHDPMYVSETDYSKRFWPDMIQEPVYLMDFNTFVKLSQHMRAVIPVAMEDAYIGLLAESAGVKPKHNDHFQMLEQTTNACHNLRMFFIYNINAYKHVQILERNMKARETNECYGAQVINPKHNMRAEDIVL